MLNGNFRITVIVILGLVAIGCLTTTWIFIKGDSADQRAAIFIGAVMALVTTAVTGLLSVLKSIQVASQVQNVEKKVDSVRTEAREAVVHAVKEVSAQSAERQRVAGQDTARQATLLEVKGIVSGAEHATDRENAR